MYSYTYDEETGGILLNSTPTVFSKEPRPVYASELDMLGFDKYWKYDKQSDVPYMWAESVQYWYRGKQVAKLKGGNLYEAPEIIIPKDEQGNLVQPEPNGKKLRPIDIDGMVKKNQDMLDIIENTTVKKIVAIYEKYKYKLDIFHVAFSGGKDSAVLLDLVKRALPKESFVVVFGDTGMEFPDTYTAVEKAKEACEEDGTPFYIARSHFDPHDSWKIFGPPARVLRWCCSVHKSAPQTLKLREITGKDNYVGMDFVGVRKHESVARSEYQYENYGKKQKGQYSFNAILEWTSAEIWLYIFAKDIYINEAYKKGNSRAGCLFCPMSGGLSNYIRRQNYTNEVDSYVDIIKESHGGEKSKKAASYVVNGGWNARKNGRSLENIDFRCVEKFDKHELTIDIISPSSNWKEWIKTIGNVIEEEEGHYAVAYKTKSFDFYIQEKPNGYVVKIAEACLKSEPTFGKYFRQVFRKASYCIGCRACEMNCPRGCIKFSGNKVTIEGCVQCHQCHNIDSGCLLFHSTRHPQGGGKGKMSLNSFADHAPKNEWLESFFKLKEDFFENHTLGPMMYTDARFPGFYRDRKRLLSHYPEADMATFVNDNRVNAAESVYKLTDNTLVEKQEVIIWIANHGIPGNLIEIYPDLAAYANKYLFSGKNFNAAFAARITAYFEKYKELTLKNVLTGEFSDGVDKLARERIYNRLPKRDELVKEKNNGATQLFWIDALGVEYLSYIVELARRRGLKISIEIGRAELPTITCENSDFYKNWPEELRHPKEEELDDIKHNDKGRYYYSAKNPYPIHLAKELEIIDRAVSDIATTLGLRTYDRVVIASDHGASRLAVLRNKEEKYETDTKGEHSGRCCKFFPNCDLPFAINEEERGYIVLADYGRFKGSRAANVEVHGGASLEEVVVPIITLSLNDSSIVISIVDEDKIKADFKTGIKITLYVNKPIWKSLTLGYGNKRYESERIDDNHYAVCIPDIKRAGTYPADVYLGDGLAAHIEIKATGKSAAMNDDFADLF